MNGRCVERSLTPYLLRAFVIATLIACIGSAGTALAKPQTDTPRRYSQDGLEMDLPGDWQLVAEAYDPWGRTFRSAATGGEIDFIIWLPLNARSYLGSFEGFVKEHLPNVQGRSDVKRLRVSGLQAIRYSQRRVWPYRDQWVRLEDHETWIGIPDGENRGTVVRFITTVEPSQPGRKAILQAYDKMLASMRIDPVILHQK
jgi:hypothetical protein